MCGLRTRPRTDVDPPRVELPSAAGGISCRRPRADNSLLSGVRRRVRVKSNALCGTLHCDAPGDGSPQKVTFQGSYQPIVWRTIGFSGERCVASSYLAFYSGPDTADPGLVPDGAACGAEKVDLLLGRDLGGILE